MFWYSVVDNNDHCVSCGIFCKNLYTFFCYEKIDDPKIRNIFKNSIDFSNPNLYVNVEVNGLRYTVYHL